MGLFLQQALRLDWDQESYPEYQDFKALLFFVFFFPLTRLILDRLIFEKLAKRSIIGRTDDATAKILQKKKINKFKESAWKFMYSASAEVIAIFVTYNEPWFHNTRYFWMGPQDQVWPDLKMKSKLKFLYMYCGGFYIYAIFALIFWETRRSDFMASMGHHLSTVALIVVSYIFRFGRIGSVVLALHEGSDVFLEIAKISKYSGFQALASIFFSLFALSWFVLRLGYYPFWVLRSTSYEILMIAEEFKDSMGGMMVHYFFFNALLYFLLLLHLFWGWKILRMLINQIRSKGQVGDDVRSDSEDEDEKEHKN